MEFYKRYTVWREAVTKVVDALHLMDLEGDWQHILTKEEEIAEWLKVIQEYKFWAEFEEFVLSTEQIKLEGFFKTVDNQIDNWLMSWRRYYNHEDHEEFKRWFYNLAYTKLHKKSEEANRIASLIRWAEACLNSISNEFEQLKSLYTSLPPRPTQLFYDRIKDRLMKIDTDSPILKYTFQDWLEGGMDEVLVRDYLLTGEDIKPLILPEKWQYFNRWLKANYDIPKAVFAESDLLGEGKPLSYEKLSDEDLVELIICRTTQHDGDLCSLFRHQTDFYPIDDLKKIYAEMDTIHVQVVQDNWYHWQKYIDIAVHNSVDTPKFIYDTIDLIDNYLNGKTIELIYPLSKPLYVSQQAIVDAYQSLLRGHKETLYIRPPHKLKPIDGYLTEEDVRTHKPQHLTNSPYVEAELLLKAKEYLKQIQAQSSPKKASENTLSCDLSDLQLTILLERFKAGRYFDIDLTLSEFFNALQGSEPLEKPLKWLKSNRDLAYLLKQMFGYKMINNKEWQSVLEKRSLFLNKDNKLLNAQDIAQAIAGYQRNGNPKWALELEVILTEIRDLKV
jgi:hypothetical protein